MSKARAIVFDLFETLLDRRFRITAIDISEKVIKSAKQFALESKRDIEFF